MLKYLQNQVLVTFVNEVSRRSLRWVVWFSLRLKLADHTLPYFSWTRESGPPKVVGYRCIQRLLNVFVTAIMVKRSSVQRT